MVKVCKRSPLQPSPASRTNLDGVRTSLRRYSRSVSAQAEEQPHGRQWSSSIDGRGSGRTVGERGKSVSDEPEVIAIESSPRSSAGSSADSGIDEDEVWADAYEYQEDMLRQRELNPSSQLTDDKENAPPRRQGADVGETSREVIDRRPTAKEQWQQAGDEISVAAGDRPEDDHFARRQRQFADIPTPPRHSPRRQEEFFTMPNHPTSHGRPPTVIYVTNENQLNGVIKLLEGPILSLDLEWIAWEKAKNVSLIQISDAFTVLLIQICHFPRFPACLKKIIEDPSIVKCGVAIMGADMSRLRDVYGVWARGVCELSFFARLVDRETHGPKNTLISLSKLAHHYLGAALAKGPVRCSDWRASPLSSEQRQYAAIDAYAGYLIFAQLERKRQLDPRLCHVWPPVSACPPPGGNSNNNNKGSNNRPAGLPSYDKRPAALAGTREIRAVLATFSTAVLPAQQQQQQTSALPRHVAGAAASTARRSSLAAATAAAARAAAAHLEPDGEGLAPWRVPAASRRRRTTTTTTTTATTTTTTGDARPSLARSSRRRRF